MMKEHKIDIEDEIKQDPVEMLEDILVGKGKSNNKCNIKNLRKEVGILYLDPVKKAVRVHNGRITGCSGEGYIVKHCSDASTGKPFKYDILYFYDKKYFPAHAHEKNSYQFIDIAISNSQNAFCYYGKRVGDKTLATHNGIFVSFTYIDPITKKPKTSNNFKTFLDTKKHPSSVIDIVYKHYVEEYSKKIHATILAPKPVQSTAKEIKHFDEIH